MVAWDQYLILKSEDALDLDRATHNLVQQGMHLNQAKNWVYNSYLKKMHAKAAAYHLDNFENTKAIKNYSDADKYYAMYSMHCNAIGLNPLLATHPMVQAYRNESIDKKQSFEPFEADILVLKR